MRVSTGTRRLQCSETLPPRSRTAELSMRHRRMETGSRRVRRWRWTPRLRMGQAPREPRSSYNSSQRLIWSKDPEKRRSQRPTFRDDLGKTGKKGTKIPQGVRLGSSGHGQFTHRLFFVPDPGFTLVLLARSRGREVVNTETDSGLVVRILQGPGISMPTPAHSAQPPQRTREPTQPPPLPSPSTPTGRYPPRAPSSRSPAPVLLKPGLL